MRFAHHTNKVMLPALLLLAGCGTSQTTRYYSLEPEAAPGAALAAHRPGSLQITGFNIPALFDRDEIMKQVAPGQFEVLEFDHWAAPFQQLARQTLIQDLAVRMAPGAVAFAGAPASADAILLSVNLVSYRVKGGSAELLVSWSIQPSSGAAGVSSGAGANAVGTWVTTSATLLTPVGDSSGAATAAGLNDLLAQLADRIVASLPSS